MAIKIGRESGIQKSILEFLNLHKILAWRNHTTGIWDPIRKVFRTNKTARGAMDILGVLANGRFLGIEVKRPGEQPTEEQKAAIANINATNGLAFVARSVTDVERALQAEGYLSESNQSNRRSFLE